MTRQTRKVELQRMTREAIIEAWRKVIASTDSVSAKTIPHLIEEILKKEFPEEGKAAASESTS